MEPLITRRSRSGISGDLAVVGSFVVSGLLTGFLFAWLTNRPSLQQFFFIRYDKFTLPRYSYWFTFGLLELPGLVSVYLVCRWRQWIFESCSTGRLVLVLLFIGLAAPVARFAVLLNMKVFRWDLGFLFSPWGLILGPLIFLILVSIALCIFSGRLKLFPIAILWNLLFLAAGGIFLAAGVRITGIHKDWADFIVWPILFSMLNLSFGNWLIWRQRTTMRTNLSSPHQRQIEIDFGVR